MLKSKAKWKFLEDCGEDTLPKDINLSSVTKKLLAQRQLTEENAIENFLHPKLSHLNDPIHLDQIDIVKERLLQAIEHKEKILIYGDYDADGITATVILLKTLRKLGAHCDYYIPNRFTEGYGPNKVAFKRAKESGFSVIVTVDTGIAAIEEATYAKSLGIDLIITDHHETQEKLPEAYAIIHPKLSPNYPFKDLAGVGIAFKLAQYLLGYLPEEFIDLVAVGTIADLVPLVEENRIFAWHGLRQLETTVNKGLQALKNICSLNKKIDAGDVGFLLAPRINAVGRLQDASLAVELLMSKTLGEAAELAEKIERLNIKRQQLVQKTTKEAIEIIEEKPLQNFIVVAKEGWNEGILGIVASQLVQKYDRPAVVLTIQREHNLAKGSARSIPAFNLFKHLHKIKDIFINFGGHSQAAGLTLNLDHLETLKDKLHQIVTETLQPEDFRQQLEISEALTEESLTETLVNEINMLAPFGIGNPKPLFLLKSIPKDVRQIGQDKSHLKLKFHHEKGTFEGIGFRMGDIFPHITPKTPIKIVGELNINEWNGHRVVQMILQDIKIKERQLFDHRDKRDINLKPFINQQSEQLIISENEILDEQLQIIPQMTYKEALEQAFGPLDDLFLFDMPKSLDSLRKIIQQTRPNNIHTCYRLEKSVYLTPFPTRDDFKWVYRYIHQFEPINLSTDVQQIAKRKRWPEELVQFMIQVFTELQFVFKQANQLYLNPQPKRRELHESKIYQQRLNQIEMEKILHYTNAQQLQQWFFQTMDERRVEEEVSHGL